MPRWGFSLKGATFSCLEVIWNELCDGFGWSFGHLSFFTNINLEEISMIGGCLCKGCLEFFRNHPDFIGCIDSPCLQQWFNRMKGKCDHGAWWSSNPIAVWTMYFVTMNLQHFDTSLTLSCFFVPMWFDSHFRFSFLQLSWPLNPPHHQNNDLVRPSSEATMPKKTKPFFLTSVHQKGWSDGGWWPWFPTHPNRFGRFGTGKRFNRSKQI